MEKPSYQEVVGNVDLTRKQRKVYDTLVEEITGVKREQGIRQIGNLKSDRRTEEDRAKSAARKEKNKARRRKRNQKTARTKHGRNTRPAYSKR